MSTTIFGAGGQGIGLIRKQGIAPDDVLLTDNNENLWGANVEGFSVVPPHQLRFSATDRVVITSSFAAEIHSQLIAAGVEKHNIFIPVKSMVTTKEVLSDGVRALALRVLDNAFKQWIVEGIPAFIDYGTLLGVWRDGKIPASDGDVDVTILVEPGDTTTTSLAGEFLLRVLGAEGRHATLISSGAQGQMIQFSSEGQVGYFDLHALQRREGSVLWRESGATELVAQEDLLPLKQINKPICALVPKNTGAYLRALYGADWETPIDDWPLSYGLSSEDFVTLTQWSKLWAVADSQEA